MNELTPATVPNLVERVLSNVDTPVFSAPIELTKALAAAQQRCKAAAKDSRNEYHKYNYASADEVVAVAKTALADSGLALVPVRYRVKVAGSGSLAFYALDRWFMLGHTSGEATPLTVEDFPVIPDKGRPLDKAVAAALTASLAYLLRDLLLMPRGDQQTDISAREDREQPPAGEQAPPQQPAAPPPSTAAARISETQDHELSVLIRETGTDVQKLLNHYKIRVLAQLPADRYDEVRNILSARKQPTTPAPVTSPSTAESAGKTPAASTSSATISAEQLAVLRQLGSSANLPVKDWLHFLGLERLDQLPGAWFHWLRLQILAKADVHELAKTLGLKTLAGQSDERLSNMTRPLVMQRIDVLYEQVGMTKAKWDARLQAEFKTTDPTQLSTEQILILEQRLDEYARRKAAETAA